MSVTSASPRLDDRALAAIFVDARTARSFEARPIPRAILERAVEIALLGPTSANTLPMRVVFVESPEAKQRLRPSLLEANIEKTMAAPVTAIIAADLAFLELLPQLNPPRAEAMTAYFGSMDASVRRDMAWDNALLQMGYFIVAARALGLDAGPMGGFDRAKVDGEFFPDGRYVSQYLINLGYGTDMHSHPRLPRLSVSGVARFA